MSSCALQTTPPPLTGCRGYPRPQLDTQVTAQIGGKWTDNGSSARVRPDNLDQVLPTYLWLSGSTREQDYPPLGSVLLWTVSAKLKSFSESSFED
ncbi:hypothetical protein J6590_013227 [Homalodisca vitripennis]|nr:hypothetical protein J6590_013227 [Homalodisca vitripennis]